jgi:hypothetical protein
MGAHAPKQTTKSKVDGVLSEAECIREDVNTVLKVQTTQNLVLGEHTKALARVLYISAGTLVVSMLCLATVVIIAVR